MGMNFFFTKKWVGGRSSLREVPARQASHPKKIYGFQGDLIPLARAREQSSRGLPLRARIRNYFCAKEGSAAPSCIIIYRGGNVYAVYTGGTRSSGGTESVALCRPLRADQRPPPSGCVRRQRKEVLKPSIGNCKKEKPGVENCKKEAVKPDMESCKKERWKPCAGNHRKKGERKQDD